MKKLRLIALVAVVLIPLAFVGLYVASIGDAKNGVDRIPAAIVNQDTAITTTNADGTTNYVLAGRQLVTQLTGSDSPGMAWTLSNAAGAKKALADGSVYAILTIPSDFSKSVLSLQGSSPVQARLSIKTDDAHSYLAGSVAQSLGDGMVRTFGSAITQQYISGVYASLGTLGASLSQAASGANSLASGASQTSTGASSLASGLQSYSGGVASLSSGLSQLNSGAASLDQLSSGVASYTGGVSQLSAALSAAVAANDTAQIQSLAAQLAAVASQGSSLSSQTASGIDSIQSGIAQSAAGAKKLAAAGPSLVSGAGALASGAGQLSSGASSLATGLSSGAAQVPKTDSSAATKSAGVASDPVGLTVSTAHRISQLAQAVATFFLPLGLWIGALAVFLVMRPVTRRILASTVASSRVVGATLVRAGGITAAQALLLVVLLHTAVGISWAYLPATLVFTLLTAAAFTAFHYLLTIGLGRAGLIISLFLLALQIAAVGVAPLQLLSTPFQAVSPFLPLSWAVNGMQQIVTGGSAGSAIGSAVALLAFGLGSVVVANLAIRRTRRASALGLVPALA